MKTKTPVVLVVDDDEQDAFIAAMCHEGVNARHVYPGDLTYDDLAEVDLILIDEFLERWPERKAVKDQPALFVRDGIALAGVLRSHLEMRGADKAQEPYPDKTAIVLRTGHLATLAVGTPTFMRPIAVAGRHDVEWVVEKGQSSSSSKLAELAKAASSLPTSWDPQAPVAQLEWLGLSDQPWREDALAQIELCRPPWSVLAETSAGRLWLAWFLQLILPFSTFLVDDLRAASFLGLKADALDIVLNGKSELTSQLRRCAYGGHLAGFAGRRWWRAGILDLRRWVLESASEQVKDDVAQIVTVLHGSELPLLGLQYPVFEIDASYQVVPDPVEISQAVRLQPDGWPPFADDPWLRTESLEIEPELAKLVVIQDRMERPDAAIST